MKNSSFLKKLAPVLLASMLLLTEDVFALTDIVNKGGGATDSSVTFNFSDTGNGTARIDSIILDFQSGDVALVTPDIIARSTTPNFVGVNSDLNIFTTTIPSPVTLPVGYLLLDAETDTLWQFDGYIRNAGLIVDWEWSVVNTNNARLGLDPDVSLGTTVLEQDGTSVVIYQKIANPGTSVNDWIEVNFEIPQTVLDGTTPYTVTSIADGAFSPTAPAGSPTAVNLQSVKLPPTLTSLGNRTFDGCTELGSLGPVAGERGVFIPAAVNTIGIAPFDGCSALQNIYVHSLSPFYSSLDGILYDKAVTKLIQYPTGKLGMAFTTPSTVTEILESAFEGNRYLVLVQTGDELTTINDRAFFASEALVQVRLGSGLETLDDSAFASIPTLGSAVFTGDWLAGYTFGTNVFTGHADNFEINYFKGAIGFTTPTWTPNIGQTYDASEVEVFGDFEFQNGTAAGTVKIFGYRGIGGNVTIPSTILGKPVRAIDSNVFRGNTNITSVTIPSSVTSIGSNAFAGAPNLTTVNLGTGVTNLGAQAFYNCDALTTITIPAGLTTIGSEALGGCDALASINVNASNPAFGSLGGVLFDKLQAKLVQYPGGLAGGTYQIPVTVTTIGTNAFKENGTLASLTIPNTVTTIEDNAFDGSLLLYDITFGTGVTSLGNSTFSNIGTLEKATFLKLQAPTTLGTGIFANAAPVFKVYYMPGASGFTQPTWTPNIGQTYNATVLTSENNFSFTTNNTTQTVTIDAYTGTNATVVIPATIGGAPVRAIADNVFKNNLVITSVTIPSSVSTIGNSTFSGALNLTSVTLGSGLTTIGTEAFKGTGITSITIPASVSTIGDGAFEDCQSLLEINVSANNQSFSSLNGVLYNRNQTSLIAYPAGAGGTEFTIPDTVKTIHDGAFKYNQNLALVEFPNNTTTINATAFQYSQSLVSVRFGTGFGTANGTLGSEAFADIPSLGSAIFFGNAPNAVGGNNTFDGASSVFKIYYLGNATGFTNPWLGKPTAQLQKFQDFLFTSSNGTVEITGFEGRPPIPGGLAQLVPDLTTRPNPNLIIANSSALTESPFVPNPVIPYSLAPNSLVLAEDTNTLWRLNSYVINNGNISGRLWTIVNTDNARLSLPANTSPGTTVLEQNNVGPMIYQKIGGTGSSTNDWIEVNFEIPDKIAGFPVTSIAAGAFVGQTLLQSVVLPDSLNKIGDRAFSGCVQLGSLGLQSSQRGVFIPAAVSQIGVSPFVGCDELSSLFVHSLNPNFISLDGVIYDKAQTKLYQYPPGKLGTQFTAPSSIRSILESAFEGNKYLTVFETSNNLNSIAARAFFGSEALVQARFGTGLNSLGNSSFSSIPALGSVVFNGNWLGNYTFGSDVFSKAAEEFVVNYYSGSTFVPPIANGNWTISGQTYTARPLTFVGDFEFTSTNGSTTISGYRGSGGNVTIPSTLGGAPVRGIGASVFAGNDLITSVTIPDSVTTIGDNAFAETLKLATVNFGNGLVSIGEQAFYGCEALTTVTLPAGVSTIGVAAFGSCINLTAINVNAANLSFSSLSGVLFDKKFTTLIQYPGGLTAESYTIKSAVIGERSFERNTKLVSLVFADSVTTIDPRAFYGMAGLTQVTFGTGNLTIGDEAFASSAAFGKATFLGYLAPTLGIDVFQGVRSPFEIEYFDGATGFDVAPWTNFTATIAPPQTPSGFTYEVSGGTVEITGFIGDDPSVTIEDYFSVPGQSPDYVVPTAEARLDLWWSLYRQSSQGVPNGTIVLQTNNNTLYQKVSGNGYFESDWQQLSAQGSLSDLNPNLPLGTVAFVGSDTSFYQKVSNSGISAQDWIPVDFQIPSQIEGMPVVAIADSAFEGNAEITSVALPNSIVRIGEKAFYKTNLQGAVYVPASVSSIGTQAFANGGKDFTSLIVNQSNLSFSSLNGVLFDRAQKTLIQYPMGRIDSSYTIPATVTAIGAGAFEMSRNLVAVTIPNGVTSIGAGAFYGSASLTQVTIGTRVSSIGNEAFAGNAALGVADFLGSAPLAPNFGAAVFAGSSPQFKVRYYQGANGFPNSSPSTWTISGQTYNTEFLSGDGDFTFSIANNQATITGYQGAGGSIQIPTTIGGFPVRSIGDGAFEGNEFLTSVTIPSTVTSIGARAFFGNINLVSIVIPASVLSIGDQAFESCTELFSIEVSASNPNYSSESGVLFDKNRNKLLVYPIGRFGNTYAIPSTVAEIGDRAFEGNRNLVTLEIPNGVVKIGARAFYNSQSLVTVRFGKGIDFIGTEAFSGPFTVLNAVYFFGKAPEIVQANAFPEPPAVFEVRYLQGSPGFPTDPLGGSWEGYSAVPFSEFGNFAFRVLANDTVEITGYTGTPPSRGAPPQVRIDFTTLPTPDRTVADQTARLALTASQVDKGEYVYQIDTATLWVVQDIVAATDTQPARVEWAVEMTNGQQLNVDTALALGSTIIVQDSNGPIVWQKVAFPGSNPSDWISVNFGIPDTIAGKPVTSIANGAFAGKGLLTSVVLPTSLTRIGANAFYDCDNLGVLSAFSGIFIPASVLTIGDGAFASCSSLDSLFVHPSSPNFFTSEGLLFSKDQTELLCYPAGRYQAVYEVPETLKAIGAQAFEGNRFLVTIELPDNVDAIGRRAFAESESLVQVTFGKQLEIIEDEAFKDVLVLGSAIFNGNAPSVIGKEVFEGVADGFLIKYFQGFTGFAAFEAMGYNIATLNKIGDFLFGVNGSGPNETAEITGYVGTGGNVTIPSVIGQLAVRSIGEGAFIGKTNVTSVTIPNSITAIKKQAFFGATKMAKVVFGSGLTRIESEAFKDCDALFEVELPASVTEIEPGAFASCDSLGEIMVDLDNPVYRSTNGVVFNKSQKVLYHYPSGRASTNYIVPLTVEEIAPRAFEGNVYLAVVDIPETVRKIGDEAFFNSLALVSVRFGKNVQSIGDRAFAGVVTPLQSAIFFGSAPTVGANLFQGAVASFEVRYLKGALGFPATSGQLWNGYKAVFLEEIDEFEFKVTSNGKVEITGYNGLAPKIVADISTLPEPSIIVGNRTQRLALTDIAVGTIVLQENIGLLYEYVGPGLASSSLSWDILNTGDARLDMAPSLGLGTTVLEQGDNGLVTYQKIANPGSNVTDWIVVDFEIPEFIAGLPVDSIAANAFKDNTIIQSVVLPNSLTKLGAGAFKNCDGLRAVFIPAGVTSYEAGSFGSCDKLEALYVHFNNPRFFSSGGVLFNKTQSSLFQFPGGMRVANYTIPMMVTKIEELAFEGNMFLVTVEIGNTCRNIAKQAFQGSQSLVSVTIGEGVKTIGDKAFADITCLTSIVFKGNAPDLGLDVFFGTSPEFQVRYTAGKSGFDKNIEPWKSLKKNLQPIWPELSSLLPSTGFRAVGYVMPASFNNNIGGQIQLAVSRSRIVSGVLMLGSSVSQKGFFPTATNSSPAGAMTSYRFKGEMGEDGSLSVTIPRPGQSDLELNLKFDLLDAPVFFKLSAPDSVLTDGIEEAPVVAAMVPWSRAYPVGPFAGIYNMAFDADSGGQSIAPGFGFAGLTVDARTGAARVVGVLGDGTRISGASWVLGDGTIPLWFPLYNNKGMLVGDLDLGEDGNSFAAELLWTKPPGVPRSPDPGGFDDVVLTAAEGSGRFTAPSLASFNNLSINFDGETESFIQGFTVEGSRIVPILPNTNQVRAAWNLRGGLVQGSFTIPDAVQPFATSRPLGRLGRFQGVILSDGTPESLKIRGNFVLPNSSTRPTEYFGGSVSN